MFTCVSYIYYIQWRPSEPEPQCWKNHYHNNPIVPSEFATLQEALMSASSKSCFSSSATCLSSRGSHDNDTEMLLPHKSQTAKNIRILLRPGSYTIEDTIVINTLHDADTVTIETILSSTKTKKSPTSLPNNKRTTPSIRAKALLVMKTRKRNTPIIRVMRGNLNLKRVTLDHSCLGTEFLFGNAAIHIQPKDRHSLLPAAFLDQVEITSYSGQGIMNYLGGNTTVKNCYIHDCAATGLFVQSPHCDLLVQRTDIMANNHAGMHLEFGGTASVIDCSIVGNTSIGVSVSSSVLLLESSDVVANGYQLETEMPPKTLLKNNIATLLEQSQAGILTRTSMAQRNLVHHMSKVTALMNNRQRRLVS